MIQLRNNCYCSELNVYPGNWRSFKASIKKEWYITYRFYDPFFKNESKYKKGKLVMLRGMNHLKTLTERQKETENILQAELNRLKELAYNPISGHYIKMASTISEIPPTTGFITVEGGGGKT